MFRIQVTTRDSLAKQQDCRLETSERTNPLTISYAPQQRNLLTSLFAILLCSGLLQSGPSAQQPSQTQVSGILTGSLGVLSAGNPAAQDVVLTGTVVTTSGAQTVQGTVRLVSNATGMTRVEINSSSSSLVETKRVSTMSPAGESQVGSGSITAAPLHNLLVDPGWFFPEHLVSRLTTSTRQSTVVPAAQMDGTTAIGVDSYLASFVPSHSATMRQMSELTVFFDQTTRLPVELQYNSHADDSLLKIIPTRIVYGNYQNVQGHMVPFNIQRYENGVLHDDITVTGVVLNPGIASSQYTLN